METLSDKRKELFKKINKIYKGGAEEKNFNKLFLSTFKLIEQQDKEAVKKLDEFLEILYDKEDKNQYAFHTVRNKLRQIFGEDLI